MNKIAQLQMYNYTLENTNYYNLKKEIIIINKNVNDWQ